MAADLLGSENPFLRNTNGAKIVAAKLNRIHIMIEGSSSDVIAAPTGKELATNNVLINISPCADRCDFDAMCAMENNFGSNPP